MEYTGTFEAGQVSFSYKVSCEFGWDYFYFYVDGVEVLEDTGIFDWDIFSHTLSAGEHTLRWEYKKDSSVSEGDDTVWVANIVMPNGIVVTPDSGTNNSPDNLTIISANLNWVVQGLNYSTQLTDGSLIAKGTTDAQGAYEYVQGREVKFYLGDMLIHTLPGTSEQAFINLDLLPVLVSEATQEFQLGRIPVDETTLLYNRLRLLTTLDSDQTPSNGIQLDDATIEKFETFPLSIDSRPRVFAANAGPIVDLLGRMLLHTNLTLFHVYQYFEIDLFANDTTTSSVYGIVLSTTEDGNNLTDSVDGVVDYTGSYEYNEYDQVTFEPFKGSSLGFSSAYNDAGYKIEYGHTVSGSSSSTLTWQYNAAGFETLYQVHNDNSNQLEDEDVSSYDSQGNLIRKDGIYVSGEATVYLYTYDEAGNLLSENYSRPGYSSSDTYQYDLANRRTRYQHTTSLGANDIITHDYDQNGNQIYYNNDRGSSIRNEVKTFDENNLLLTFKYTLTIGSRIRTDYTTYQYNINDELIGSQVDKADTGLETVLDGVIELEYEYSYDPNGYLLYSNIVGELPSSIFEYNTYGLLIQFTSDQDKDGTSNSFINYEYDGNDILSKTIKDNAADGAPELITTWQNRPTRMIQQ